MKFPKQPNIETGRSTKVAVLRAWARVNFCNAIPKVKKKQGNIKRKAIHEHPMTRKKTRFTAFRVSGMVADFPIEKL